MSREVIGDLLGHRSGLLGSSFLAMYSYASNNPLAAIDPTGKFTYSGGFPVGPGISGGWGDVEASLALSSADALAAVIANAALGAQTALSEAIGEALGGFGSGTAFFGAVAGYTSAGAAVTSSVGVVGDTEGNLGVAYTSGVGFGMGADFSAGAQAAFSNAVTIGDLEGPFADFGVSVQGFGVDYFSGPSADGFVNGLAFSWGAGIGAGSSYTVTNTVITPFFGW